MRKNLYSFLVMAILLAVSASACSAIRAAPTAFPAPTKAVEPVDVGGPTPQVPVSLSSAPSFAPTCPNVTAACTAPEVVDTVASETTCVNKVPYQFIFVPEGITFEVLDPANLTCVDNGAVVDGMHVLECRGTQLWTTELKLTNVACGSNALQTSTGQCQQGFGFDATQNCCAPVTSEAGNSVTIKVNLGSCPDGPQP